MDVWSLPPIGGESEDHPSDHADKCCKGYWSKEYKANKSHDCVGNDPYCPGEIREGEYYKREAILIREQGARGTVLVTKTCLVCQGGNR